MARSRFDRARKFVNAANLVVSVALVAGAAWAISTRAGPGGGSWLSR